VLIGPSGGYILGFLLSAFIVQKLNSQSQIINLVIFHLALFPLGVAQLSLFVGLKAAIHSGFVIFILPETIKIIAALLIYKAISKNTRDTKAA
jgi:biotin transport system substrate-specific component